ncbi:MAG: PAS domain S-box protein [Anaerolineales bacterium]
MTTKLTKAELEDELKKAKRRIATLEKKASKPSLMKEDKADWKDGHLFRTLIENSKDIIGLIAADGTILYKSPSIQTVMGYLPEENIGRNSFDFMHPEDRQMTQGAFTRVMNEPNTPIKLQMRYLHKNGEWKWVEVIATNLLDDPSIQAIVVNYRDITEEKLMHEKVQADEARYRNLFDESPISLWEEDFSEVKKQLDELKRQGVTDFRQYFKEHPEFVAQLPSMVKVLDVNNATIKLFEAENKNALLQSLGKIVSDDEETAFGEQILSFMEGTTDFYWTGINRTLKGNKLDIQLHISILPGYEETLEHVVVSILNVTKIKQAQEEIDHLSSFPILNPNVVLEFNLDGNVEFCNKATWDILNEQKLNNPKEFLPHFQEVVQELDQSKDRLIQQEVKIGDRTFALTIQLLPDLKAIRVYGTDITAGKQAELALMESEEKFRSVVEQAYEGIGFSNEKGVMIEWNQTLETITEFKHEEIVGMSIWDVQKLLTPDEIPFDETQIERLKSMVLDTLQNGTPFPTSGNLESKIKTRSGRNKYISQVVFPVKIHNGYRIATLIRDLTEKKSVEAELQVSNAKYQSISEDMPALISRFKHDGTLTYVNPFYCQYYKKSPEEFIGKTLFEMVPESEWNFVKRNYLSLTREKPFVTYEFKAFTPDGKECWQRWTDRALFNDAGEIIEFQSLGEDITERKLTEEMLIQSESRFRSLIANASDLILVVNTDGNITYASPSFEKILGTPAQDVIGKNFLTWVDPDEVPEIKSQFEKRIKTPGGAIHSLNVRARHKDGTWKYLDVLDTNLINIPAINGIVLNVRDVTENEMANVALRQSEERFSKAFQSIPAGVTITKIKDGTVVNANATFLKITGYSQREIIGNTFKELGLYLTFSDRQEMLDTLARNEKVLNRETKLCKKSGEVVITLISMEIIKLASEEHLLSSFIDITERKAIEEALRISELNLSHAQAVSHTGSWYRNLQQNLLIWSDETYRIFDVPKGTPVTYEKYHEYIHPDDRKTLDEKWNAALHHKATPTYTTEYRITVHNEIKWVNEEVEIEFSSNNEPIAVFGVIQDVTKQRRFEQEKQALTEIMQGLAISKDLHEFLGLVHQSIGRVIPAKNFFVTLHNESTELFEDAYFVDQYDEPFSPSKRENTLTRYIFTTSTPLMVTNEILNKLISEGKVQLIGTYSLSWLGIPLKISNKTIGVMVIQDYESPNLYSKQDLEFLESLSGQVALAVERKRTESENERQLSELETLYESGLTLSKLHTPSEIAQKTIEVLERKMNWHHIAIRQYHAETDSMELIAFKEPGLDISEIDAKIKALAGSLTSPDEGLSGWVTRSGVPVIVPNVKVDKRYKEVVPNIKSGVYVPLLFNNRVIGSVAVESEQENAFNEHDQRLLMTLTGQTAISIENARLYTLARNELHERQQAEISLQRQTDELNLLLDASRELSNTFELKSIYTVLHKYISQGIPCDQMIISSYNPNDQLIRCEYLITENGEQDVSNFPPIPLEPEGSGTQSIVIRTNKSLLLSDYLAQLKKAQTTYLFDENGEILPEQLAEEDEDQVVRSAILVPLTINASVAGVLQVFHAVNNIFTEAHLRFAEALAFRVSGAMANARLFQQLQQELIERRLVEEEIRLLNADLEKHVEERTAEIEATKKRLELATRAAGLGIWEWDLQTDKLTWDAQMHKIYSIPIEEFTPNIQTFMNVVHPEDQLDLVKIAQAVLNKEEHYQTEYRIIKKDGTTVHIAAQGLTIYDSQGEAEKIIGTVRDITEQKQAEQALRESGEYARLLFDAAPDPVSVATVDGIMVDVNKLFEQQHHIKREEIREKHISELNIFPPGELEKAGDYIAEILQEKTVPPVELDFYAAENDIHTLEMHSYPIEVNGELLVLSTSRDITLHKKAEETLRLANAEKERALRMKDEFLASMSHELRTPLNAILGISESLEEQVVGELNSKQMKYLRTINESGKHLLELINDILDLSKIEAGRLEINILDLDVEHLCTTSLRMVRELAQKKNINIEFSSDTNARIIKGDERRLKQALVNLLSNAVKFTPNDGKIGLEVKGNAETHMVTFTVWDTGIGIKQENMERLFKPFVQLDSSLAREYSGTGLGLALVAQMVRLHGGNVSAVSELGKGSRFTVILPWIPEKASSSKALTENEHAEETMNNSKLKEKRTGKVMLVEDTEAVVLLIADYLKFLGYEVIIARNGLQAVSKAEDEKPDAILMDVMMPGMDGLDATKKIRTIEGLQQTPIIALTALAMPGDREQCMAAGMNDYLSKPILMQDLAKVLDTHLKKTN